MLDVSNSALHSICLGHVRDVTPRTGGSTPIFPGSGSGDKVYGWAIYRQICRRHAKSIGQRLFNSFCLGNGHKVREGVEYIFENRKEFSCPPLRASGAVNFNAVSFYGIFNPLFLAPSPQFFCPPP